MDELRQFVEEAYCLSCEGCCRFKEADSVWRPRLTPSEKRILEQNPLAREMFKGSSAAGPDERVRARGCAGGGCLCGFLSPEDNLCQIYRTRPFECRFYPFLLVRHGGDFEVAVHRHCPYVRDFRQSPKFMGHVEYLRKYFCGEDILAYLRDNRSLAGDYAAYEDELEYLFKIEGIRIAGEA